MTSLATPSTRQEELTVVWLLLITVIVATYLIQSYRIKLLPPSSSALVLGVFFGIVSRVFGLTHTLRFSPAAFFYALLPPIVFAAGFTLKKRSFFDNIGTYWAPHTYCTARPEQHRLLTKRYHRHHLGRRYNASHS